MILEHLIGQFIYGVTKGSDTKPAPATEPATKHGGM